MASKSELRCGLSVRGECIINSLCGRPSVGSGESGVCYAQIARVSRKKRLDLSSSGHTKWRTRTHFAAFHYQMHPRRLGEWIKRSVRNLLFRVRGLQNELWRMAQNDRQIIFNTFKELPNILGKFHMNVKTVIILLIYFILKFCLHCNTFFSTYFWIFVICHI